MSRSDRRRKFDTELYSCYTYNILFIVFRENLKHDTHLVESSCHLLVENNNLFRLKFAEMDTYQIGRVAIVELIYA